MQTELQGESYKKEKYAHLTTQLLLLLFVQVVILKIIYNFSKFLGYYKTRLANGHHGGGKDSRVSKFPATFILN